MRITSDGHSITRECEVDVDRDRDYDDNDNLYASCTVNPYAAYTGDNVTWTVTNLRGGNGRYTFSWSGTDGLSGRNQSVYRSYHTPGTKSATVKITSDGDSITRRCTIDVGTRYFQPPVYPPQYPGNGVSLSALPYTGLDSNMKVLLFTLALSLWSAAVTYYVIVRRKMKAGTELALATASGDSDEVNDARGNMFLAQDTFMSELESYARSQNVIASGDALSLIAQASGGSAKKAQNVLSGVAQRYAEPGRLTTLSYEKSSSCSRLKDRD